MSHGTIPAGATSITLVDSAPCRLGQLDIKAVFTGNGDARGRIGGPWISNGTDCSTPTTSVGAHEHLAAIDLAAGHRHPAAPPDVDPGLEHPRWSVDADRARPPTELGRRCSPRHRQDLG